MSEFAPPGSNARMTKAQMRKYLRDMKEIQEKKEQELAKAAKNGDLETSPEELARLEDSLDDAFENN